MGSKFKIFINDLKLFGYHGVRKKEKENGQDFLFNVIATIDASDVKNDELSSTLNYSDVIRIIKNINKNNRFELLETLSAEISREIISNYPFLKEILVSVSKPEPPIDEELEEVGVSFVVGEGSDKSEFILSDKYRIYLSLGSNLGDRESNLRKAVSTIEAADFIEIDQVSSIYETEPMYDKDQDYFYNIVLSAEIQRNIDLFVFLGYLKSVEYKLGRKKEIRRFGPRVIDIDIIYCQDVKIDSDFLTIPHAGLAERKFVLVPLSEISPYFELGGKNIRKIIKDMEDGEAVKFIKDW